MYNILYRDNDIYIYETECLLMYGIVDMALDVKKHYYKEEYTIEKAKEQFSADLDRVMYSRHLLSKGRSK